MTDGGSPFRAQTHLRKIKLSQDKGKYHTRVIVAFPADPDNPGSVELANRKTELPVDPSQPSKEILDDPSHVWMSLPLVAGQVSL